MSLAAPPPLLAPRAPLRPLTRGEFEQIRLLARQKFGLDFGDSKQQLVSGRLERQMRQLSFLTFQEYYQHVLDDRTGAALIAMIDALTTNYTSFFREPAHFEVLRRAIAPDLRDRQRINIWSAACSTGEEPYSIAVCLLDELGLKALPRIHILATDISTSVLANAQRAIYPVERFQDFDAQQLHRYMLRGAGRWQGSYRVKKEIRDAIEFRRLNLMDPLSDLGPFAAIFCRNVMIYFDKPTQQALVDRMADRLEPGGYLLVGHSESLSGIHHSLCYVQPAVYRKAGHL